MLFVAVFSLLALSAVADSDSDSDYSFIPPVGSGSGSTYSITGDGRITAIRVWERYSSYVSGIQIRYEYIWSQRAGYEEGTAKEIELYADETIVQISGKYASYIQSLVFVTSRGRSLFVGQPAGHSFNMYPANQKAELRFLSGRASRYLSSLGSHWAVFKPHNNGTTMH